MRNIAIVGGGQAGLLLALGLQNHGYPVTLVNNRHSDEIRNGKVLSSQCLFHSSLEIEQKLGIKQWDDSCPPIEGIGLKVIDPHNHENSLISWRARLDNHAKAVDQRMKFPALMEHFSLRGGKLVIQEADIDLLEILADEHDLVILAGGKGEITQQFTTNELLSTFTQPQRILSLAYVHGMQPTQDHSQISFNLLPGAGEYFVIPALTFSGPCDIMFFEAIPGGPLDCWSDVTTPEQHLARAKSLLSTYFPDEYQRAKECELTDLNATLHGRFTPTVRHPVMTLPSGKLVLGLGDTVVLNDPLTGQGANSATKASNIYLDAILAQRDKPFTQEWMNETFEQYWQYAQYVSEWTNSLLAPPAPHILSIIGEAQHSPSLSHRITNAFDNPPDLFPWWRDGKWSEVI
ncbi:styrene monooxygenase/indole monooxygenase family protein [Rouxiella sp. Mn2063]|uniref:styrene monooxygenase/indole monooxygenase family protein n=1 Tax=Rouxiella sp. Mn2063 TaxID=3395262 RepID=UPI003BCF5C6A